MFSHPFLASLASCFSVVPGPLWSPGPQLCASRRCLPPPSPTIAALSKKSNAAPCFFSLIRVPSQWGRSRFLWLLSFHASSHAGRGTVCLWQPITRPSLLSPARTLRRYLTSHATHPLPAHPRSSYPQLQSRRHPGCFPLWIGPYVFALVPFTSHASPHAGRGRGFSYGRRHPESLLRSCRSAG